MTTVLRFKGFIHGFHLNIWNSSAFVRTECRKKLSCGQFYQRLPMNFTNVSLSGSFFYLHVTREKLPKRRSYKKCVRKTLMKLTPDMSSVSLEYAADTNFSTMNEKKKTFHVEKDSSFVIVVRVSYFNNNQNCRLFITNIRIQNVYNVNINANMYSSSVKTVIKALKPRYPP